MKTLIRAVYSVVAILIVTLTTYLPVHAQKRIEDRFANVNGVVIKGNGHWLMEEAPREVIPRLVKFINKAQ